jgi:hypothetical protein
MISSWENCEENLLYVLRTDAQEVYIGFVQKMNLTTYIRHTKTKIVQKIQDSAKSSCWQNSDKNLLQTDTGGYNCTFLSLGGRDIKSFDQSSRWAENGTVDEEIIAVVLISLRTWSEIFLPN